jgi:hypothetical protein
MDRTLASSGTSLAKKRCAGKHAGQQQRGIDRRSLALPSAATRPHIEKMVVKAAISRGIRLGSVGTVQKEVKCSQRPLNRIIS